MAIAIYISESLEDWELPKMAIAIYISELKTKANLVDLYATSSEVSSAQTISAKYFYIRLLINEKYFSQLGSGSVRKKLGVILEVGPSWLTNWLADWLIMDWLTVGFADWLTEWLVGRLASDK